MKFTELRFAVPGRVRVAGGPHGCRLCSGGALWDGARSLQGPHWLQAISARVGLQDGLQVPERREVVLALPALSSHTGEGCVGRRGLNRGKGHSVLTSGDLAEPSL